MFDRLLDLFADAERCEARVFRTPCTLRRQWDSRNIADLVRAPKQELSWRHDQFGVQG